MKHICPILLSLFLCLACTKDVDFDQIDDVQISPILESSVIYFETAASGFIEGGAEVPVTMDFIEIDVFNSSFINENITKVDFVFETENTLPRDFNFYVDFLDENGDFLDNYTFNTSDTPPYIKTFEGADIDILTNTSILSFTLTMLSGTPINTDTPGVLSLKSKGVFYFNIEN